MFPLVEGQTLLGVRGRYRFLSRLASGTFAVILKALDSESGRAVAIKCTHEAALNAIAEREAAMLRALNARDAHAHVAVVRLLDCFTEQRHFCLVLELLGDAVVPFATAPTHGGPQPWRQARPPPFLLNDRTGEPQHKLFALVYHRRHVQQSEEEEEEEDEDEDDDEEGGALTAPLPLAAIRQMAVHLCAALAFVHDQGLIHADLKPENVVQIQEPSSPAGLSATVKLVDFGNCIERRQLPLYEAEDAADDSGGFDIQTLAYRAPEVAMGVAIAPAMDLWSLGCLLVECATGCPLFGATTVAADGTSQHSLTNAVELIEQIEWLLTGGVPLGKSRPLLYGNARHYKFRVEQQQATMARQARLPRQHERATVARYLPLRHRLQANRPETEAASEWIEFQDFVERLLDVDPTTRLTARAAFLHPFLQKVFPFQFMFAPEGSPFQQRAVMIDTSPSDEESDPQQEQQSTQSGKKKRTTRGREDQGEQLALARGQSSQKKKRHVSGSLRHALELIPKPSSVSPPPMVVKQEPSTRSLIGEILEEKKARYRRKVYNN